MIVEEIMTKEVHTLQPHDKIESALNILHKYRVRHIPIINDHQNIVGIVSDRDIRDASPSILEKDQNLSILENKVETIMSSPVITVHPLDFIEEVASIFYKYEIACVPVTQQNKLIGMVTEKDLLYTLIQITGIHEQSSQIEVRVPHEVGVLPKVAQVVSNRNTNISSVFIYPSPDEPSERTIVMRVQTMNPLPLVEDLRKQGYKVIWPNIQGF